LSLIGAIPGGYLSYRLVMAMVYHFRDMVGMMKVVVSLILVLSAAVTLIPIGILIFVKEEKDGKSADEETGADEVVEDVDAEEVAELPDGNAGEKSVVIEETQTRLEMSGDFDDFVEAEEEPEPKGKKKKKKRK
jgi:hypothetical protein